MGGNSLSETPASQASVHICPDCGYVEGELAQAACCPHCGRLNDPLVAWATVNHHAERSAEGASTAIKAVGRGGAKS